MTPTTNPERPWQVTVGIALIATWWVSSIVTLFLVVGARGADEVAAGLLGYGFWSVVLVFLLRNVWRGGGSTPYLAKFMVAVGTAYEIAGLGMVLLWFYGAGPLPLGVALAQMVIAVCAFYGGRLLLSPAAKEFRVVRCAA